MSVASATLFADITNSQLLIKVAAGSGARFPVFGPFLIQIDTEVLNIIGRDGDHLEVSPGGRGSNSTSAASHTATTAVVLLGGNGAVGNLTGDVTGNVTGNLTGNVTGNVTGTITGPVIQTPALVSGDGALTFPGSRSITKGSAAALTLATPAGGDDGKALRVISRTGFAHVITTAANKIINGATPGDTLTFAAVAGASIELVADNSLWVVRILSNVVLSEV